MQTPSKTKHLLILDSGVGGLSIAQEIREAFSDVQISYIADNAHYPYGTKNEADLIHRLEDLTNHYFKSHRADAIVIACNTASTLVLPHMRKTFSLPIIGVVPAIKPAAKNSQSKVIGLLATPGTVQRKYTETLIKEFAPNCEIIKVGSSTLVDFAEKRLEFSRLEKLDFSEVLEPFWSHPRASEIDTIVLGCTHFPLVKQELQAQYNKDIDWIDSGEAIAKQVGRIFETLDTSQTDAFKTPNADINHQFFFTQEKTITPKLKYSLHALGMEKINFMDCQDT